MERLRMNVRGLILPSRIVGILILLPALIAAGVGGWFYHRTAVFLEHARQATGTIVAMQPSASGEGGATYTPVFTFTDERGVAHRITSGWSTNPPAYAVGDSVKVYYQPGAGNNPPDARLASFWNLWLGATICGSIAAPFLLFAMVFLWLIPFTLRRVFPPPPPLPGG
jgi:hypothetical protein